MAEFDLIPADYHAARRWRRALGSAAMFYALSMALGLALLHALGADVGALRRFVADQSARAELGETLAAELERARAAIADQEQLLTTLARLRGGVGASQPFELLDATLDDSIVLSAWDFQRVDANPAAAEATTQDLPPARLLVRGTASGNAALIAFVSRLEARLPRAKVRIVSASGQAQGEGVVFDLEARYAASPAG